MPKAPSRNRKKGFPCVICGHAGSKTGEHVIPRWLAERLYPDAAGPYEIIRRDRAGEATKERTTPEFQNRFAPMCQDCNSRLSQRFEKPETREALLDVLVQGREVAGSAVQAVGEWFLKTLLLFAHPDTRLTNPTPRLDTTPTSPPWQPPEPSLYTWMTTKLPPPDSLSVWLYRTKEQQAPHDDPLDFPLPTVEVGNRHWVFGERSLTLGVPRVGTTSADAQLILSADLVYHPHWEVTHPFSAEQRALRLWPPTHSTIPAFQSLTPVDRTIRWLYGTNGSPLLRMADGNFGPGIAQPELLTSTTFRDLTALPGEGSVELRFRANR